MMYQHKGLASGRWGKLSFLEQMANIGSEVERSMGWRKKGNPEYGRQAFTRTLELLEFTIADQKNKKRLRELTRLREILIDYFVFENVYKSTDQSWHNYFYPFHFAARRFH